MGPVSREAIAEEVRRLLAEDRAGGALRPVEEYQARFPGNWDLVAREFRAAERDRGAAGLAVTAVGGAAALGAAAEGGGPEARIGPYLLLRELGRGGMGVVHEAQDLRLQRRVALKLLAPGFAASGPLRLRFEREAAVAARLDHPGIAAVYEAGEADGTAFIAMRFVEGRPLSEWIADGRAAGRGGTVSLPGTASDAETAATPSDGARTTGAPGRTAVDRVLRFFEGAARALHHAHEQGLVHRDVKPANLMVARSGEPVLLDFGLAREEEGEGQGLTQTGHLMGTPAYMSPEQLTAQRIRVDRRTDVYSLGVSLYEALTLALPFEAPTREGLYKAILTSDPADPRHRNRAVGADLKVVIETAMEKDRDLRYGTALDLAEDLRRVREREPVRARPPAAMVRLWRWVERSPTLARVGAVVLMLGVGLGISAFVVVRSERDARDVALEGERAQAAAKESALAREREARLAAERAREATEQALRRARALGLVGASREAGESDPILALHLAIAAAEQEMLPAVAGRLHEGLVAARERAVLPHGVPVGHVEWSPSGDRVATGAEDGGVRLWDASGRAGAVLTGHTGPVRALAWSRTGDRLLSGSADGSLRIWSADGRSLAVLRGHSGPILDAAALPAGGWISGSEDATARLWSASGEDGPVLRGHGGAVGRVAVSGSGDLLATGAADGVIRLWRADGTPRGTLEEDGAVTVVRISPAGDRILSTSRRREVLPQEARLRLRIRDPSGLVLATIEGFVNFVADAAWSPDGARVAVHNMEGSVSLWTAEGASVRERAVSPLAVGNVEFSPDGSLVVAACADNALHVWDREGEEVAVLRGHRAAVPMARFSPGGDALASVSDDGTARLWAVDTGEIGAAVPFGRDRAVLGRISASGHRVACWEPRGSAIRILDGALQPVADLRGLPAPVALVEGDRELRLLAVVLTDGSGFLADGSTGARLHEFPAGEPPLAVLSPSAAGDLLLAVDRAGGSALWNPAGQRVAVLEGGTPGRIGTRAWDPDGARVAITRGPEVRVWRTDGTPDASFTCESPVFAIALEAGGGRILVARGTVASLHDPRGEPLAVLRGHDHVVRRVAFSPDGALLLTGGMDLTARLWDASGAPRGVLRGHRGEVLHGSFASDGARVITAALRDSVRVWDLGGRVVDEIRIPGSPVEHSARARDKDVVLTTHADGVLRLWTLDTGELLRRARSRLTRPLDEEDRIRYRDLLGDLPGR